jgi:hypothetical protein
MVSLVECVGNFSHKWCSSLETISPLICSTFGSPKVARSLEQENKNPPKTRYRAKANFEILVLKCFLNNENELVIGFLNCSELRAN